MKKRIYFLIASILIIAFIFSTAFLFNQFLPIEIERNLTIYWIIKITYLGVLLLISIYLILRKQEISHIITIYVWTLALQLIPLFARILLRGNDILFTLAIILSALALIIYLILVLTFDILTDKTNRAEERLLGKTHAVVDEDDFFDEDGNFVGANKKVNR